MKLVVISVTLVATSHLAWAIDAQIIRLSAATGSPMGRKRDEDSATYVAFITGRVSRGEDLTWV